MDTLTAEELRRLLHYDPETGAFTWRVKPARQILIGAVAGTTNGHGYVIIRIHGRIYCAHRLAWLYMKGEWPPDNIDHKNGARADNRFRNLRNATYALNQQNRQGAQTNNTTGFLGVYPKRNGFAAMITVAGKRWALGVFDTPARAHAVYLDAKRRLHPGGLL